MKDIARRVINKIMLLINVCVITIRYFCTNKNNRIVINAWMLLYGKEPIHRNLGDELNYYLIRELTGKQVFNFPDLLPLKIVNYSCIGSISEWRPNSYNIFWGTGALHGKKKISPKPLKVCAVRGPLTRKFLLAQGIDCPEIYGDPALLLPRIYTPNKTKKHKMGIIPHIFDSDDPLIDKLIEKGNKQDIVVIKMGGYKDWHNVIDEICECEFIISSSLHGLILSDAYNVPNMWVEFSDKVIGNRFKFHDYFASVGHDVSLIPIRITLETKFDDLLGYKKRWEPIAINLDKLIDSCPFKIDRQKLYSSL